MKHVVPSACLAAAFAVGLSAQTPSPAPEAQASSPKSVTVTGCLKAGDEPGSFALSNIKTADKAPSAASSTTTTGTTGATGTAGSTTTTTTTTVNKDLENATVKLTGSPSGVKMDDHIGHTVRVTGTLNAAAPSASATAGAPAGAPAASASAGKAQPSLDVSSLSMVSGSCSM